MSASSSTPIKASPTAREQFQQLVEDALAFAQPARRERCRRRGLRRRRPVGVGAQGRDRERRAQPRQVDRRDGLHAASAAATRAPRTSRARRSSRRCVRPTTSRASPPRTRPPACPTRPTWRSARPPRATSTCSTRGRSTPQGAPRSRSAARPPRSATDTRITNSEGAGVSAQQSHFFAGNSRGFRGGYASSRHSLSVAPIARARQGRRRHAARRLVQLDARRRRAGRARGGGPLCRRTRAVAPEVAQDRDLRGAGAVRVDARRRACSAPTCRPPAAARCTASRASCSTAWASRCCAEHIDIHEDPHVPRGKGSAPFDDEGVRHARARRGQAAAWCRATSCRAIRRASSACAPPATPAARRT